VIPLNASIKLPSRVKWYALLKLIVILFLISLPVLLFSSGAWFIFLCILLALLGVPIGTYLLLSISKISFLIDKDKITLDSGILSKKSKTITFDKVQNVDSRRSILARMFGLAKISVWTASPSQIEVRKGNSVNKADLSLYLVKDEARWLKEFISAKGSG